MKTSGGKKVSVAAWPLLALIAIYRYVFSPLLHLVAPGSGCRYQPTCSGYAVDALRQYGAARGGWLALRRILDCHPWGGHGYDPVPMSWRGWRFSRRQREGEEPAENGASSSLPPGR